MEVRQGQRIVWQIPLETVEPNNDASAIALRTVGSNRMLRRGDFNAALCLCSPSLQLCCLARRRGRHGTAGRRGRARVRCESAGRWRSGRAAAGYGTYRSSDRADQSSLRWSASRRDRLRPEPNASRLLPSRSRPAIKLRCGQMAFPLRTRVRRKLLSATLLKTPRLPGPGRAAETRSIHRGCACAEGWRNLALHSGCARTRERALRLARGISDEQAAHALRAHAPKLFERAESLETEQLAPRPPPPATTQHQSRFAEP